MGAPTPRTGRSRTHSGANGAATAPHREVKDPLRGKWGRHRPAAGGQGPTQGRMGAPTPRTGRSRTHSGANGAVTAPQREVEDPLRGKWGRYRPAPGGQGLTQGQMGAPTPRTGRSRTHSGANGGATAPHWEVKDPLRGKRGRYRPAPGSQRPTQGRMQQVLPRSQKITIFVRINT